MGLPFGVECGEARSGFVAVIELFFGSTLKAICSDLGGILGGFWEPEMVPKSMFPMFVSMFFSRLISASIFSRL